MTALNDEDTPEHKTLRSVVKGIDRTDVTLPAYRRFESPSYSGFTNAKSVSCISKEKKNGC